MIILCEIASRTIVPSFRAMVAKELFESYKMKQDNIANLLGITQSAVSQYLSNTRGRALDLEGINEVVDIVKAVSLDLTSNLPSKIVCQRCCEVCKIVREKMLLCQFHERLDPLYDAKGCDICIPDQCL